MPYLIKVISSFLLLLYLLTERADTVVGSESATRSIPHTQALNYSFSKPVIYFGMYKQSTCEGDCDCSCHSRSRYQTPLMLRNLVGTLFLGYTGSSLLRPNCGTSTCRNRAGRSFQLTYCFPQWFLERAIHIVAALTYTGSPVFGLEVRRRIGWGSEDGILRFALTGNTVGVKSLLDVGKASMTDVDPNHGRTALYVSLRDKTPAKLLINNLHPQYAVQYNQTETCEFLLKEGADPYAQDDYGM